METENDYEPRTSAIEGALMIGTAFVFDAIDFILTFFDLAFFIGEILKLFNGAIAFATLFFWVKMKGMGALRTVAGSALEFIPLVNALPIRTVVMAITVYLDHHPAEAEIAQAAARFAKPKSAARRTPSPKTTLSA